MNTTTRENSGVLFNNQRRLKDTSPDHTGNALIGGIGYFVNGWRKEGPSGSYISLSFRRKDEVQPKENRPAPAAAGTGAKPNGRY